MGFFLQDASSGSGGGGQAIATALSTATSTTSAGWGSTQDISCTATGLTITLPAIAGGDISPVAKRITLANTGTNAYTDFSVRWNQLAPIELSCYTRKVIN